MWFTSLADISGTNNDHTILFSDLGKPYPFNLMEIVESPVVTLNVNDIKNLCQVDNKKMRSSPKTQDGNAKYAIYIQ